MPVEFVEVAVRDAAHELLEFNPAAKVPSLELEDGVVLSETRLICEHLESLSDKRVLATVDDHLGRHWEGLVGGFMDGIGVWVREMRRPASEQSPGILELEKNRSIRCLDHFEKTWHCDLETTFAPIMLASAIELMDKRLAFEWRTGRPMLSSWFDEISKTSELKHTSPCD